MIEKPLTPCCLFCSQPIYEILITSIHGEPYHKKCAHIQLLKLKVEKRIEKRKNE